MTPAQLREWREVRGLTWAAAATLLGVSVRYYAYAEAGRNSGGQPMETIPPRIEVAIMRLRERERAA